MIRAAATDMSAERPTTTGLLPPSSSVTGTRFSAAARITCRPIEVAPVKTRWSKGRAEKAWPTSGAAGDHGDLALVEGAGEHLLQQLRRCRRRLGRLDHRPVAGSEDTRQRREGEVDREVPRADHARPRPWAGGGSRPWRRGSPVCAASCCGARSRIQLRTWPRACFSGPIELATSAKAVTGWGAGAEVGR